MCNNTKLSSQDNYFSIINNKSNTPQSVNLVDKCQIPYKNKNYMTVEKRSRILLCIIMLIIHISNKIKDCLHRLTKVINPQNLMVNKDQKINHFSNKCKVSLQGKTILILNFQMGHLLQNLQKMEKIKNISHSVIAYTLNTLENNQ